MDIYIYVVPGSKGKLNKGMFWEKRVLKIFYKGELNKILYFILCISNYFLVFLNNKNN